MSIIVDALRKVQHKDDAFQEYDYGTDYIPETEHDEKQKSSSIRWLVTYIIIPVVIFAVVFNFFLYQDNNRQESFFEENLQTLNEETQASETSLDSSPASPTSVEDKIEDQVALNSVEEMRDFDFMDDFSEKNITEEFEPLETPLAVDDLQEDEQKKDQSLPPKHIPLTVQNTHEKVVTLNPKQIPAWIEKGIKQYKKGSLTKAMKTWRNGLRTLSNETMLFSIMINYKAANTHKLLKSILDKKLPVFVVNANFRSRKAHYVMVLPNQSKIEQTKTEIQKQLGIEPYAMSKRLLYNRVLGFERKAFKKKRVKKTRKPVVNINQLIDKAKLNVQNGQYRQAVKSLSPHVKTNSNNWSFLFWLGSAELGLGNYANADDLLNKAQKLQPTIPQIWTQRALAAQEMNKHSVALQLLFKAQELAPKSPKIIFNIAYSYEALGDKNGAAYAYQDFMALTENNPEFSDLRSTALMRLNGLVYQ